MANPQQFEVCATGAKKIFALDGKFDVNMVATGTPAQSITLSADAARPIILSQVFYSYSGVPVGGNVTISDGSSNTYFNLDVTASGAGTPITFAIPLAGATNSNVVVTLASGGASITGKLNLVAYKLT